MTLENLPLSTEDRELFLLDAEAILFCRRTNRLFYLNTTAAFLWCCLEEGLAPSDAATAISKQFQVPQRLATRDVEAFLADWRSHGLIDGTSAEVVESEIPPPAHHLMTQAMAPPNSGVLPERQRVTTGLEQVPANSGKKGTMPVPDATVSVGGGMERNYRVGKLHLRIGFSSPKSELLVHPVLAHLAAGTALSHDVLPASLEIGGDGPEFTLHRNGVELNDSIPATELVPLVQRAILLTAYESSGCMIGIHAAAVGNANGCLLMPGVPGSGKSTLTAALIRSGFTYLTDELVLLMPTSHSVRPVPVSLGSKPGSWPVLAPLYQGLNTLPVFRQQDGTEVKYLAPPGYKLPVNDEHTVTRVVFPRYDTSEPPGLRELTAADALYRLAEAGYAVPGGLQSSVVAELIAWMRRLDCYELRIRDASTAVSELTRLMA